MKGFTTEPIRSENFENEFIPPLDLPETWGIAWDRQLDAALAWQAAGADADRETPPCTSPTTIAANDDELPPAHAGASDDVVGAGVPTMRTLTRMNTLLGALREQVLQIQSGAANVAIAEMSRRQATASDTTAEGEASMPLRAENVRRLAELTQAWFEIMTAAQTGMTALTGTLPAHPRADEEPRGSPRRKPPFTERRTHAMTIDFPDRRAAA